MKNDAERIIKMNELNLKKVWFVIETAFAEGKINSQQSVFGKMFTNNYVVDANARIEKMSDISDMTTEVIKLDRRICRTLEKMKIYDDYLLA